MRNLKRQLQQMVKSAGKGKRGGKSPSQQPASSSSASLPPPSSQTDKQKAFAAMRKVEKFRYQLAGSNKKACVYWQMGTCNRGANCGFEHVCLRCHHADHTCLDAACRAAPVLL